MERARVLVVAAVALVAIAFSYRVLLGLVYFDAWWLRWPVLTSVDAAVALLAGFALFQSCRELVRPRLRSVMIVAISLGVLASLFPGVGLALEGAVPDIDLAILQTMAASRVGLASSSLILLMWALFEARLRFRERVLEPARVALDSELPSSRGAP